MRSVTSSEFNRAVCDQLMAVLDAAAARDGIVVPKFATIEVQIHDGRVAGIQVSARFRPASD